MKKIVISIIILTISLFTMANSGEVKGKLALGSGSNCTGFGFCGLSGLSSNNEQGVKVEMSIDKNTNILIIKILENELKLLYADKLNYFQNKTSVTLESNFVFPSEFTEQLQSSKPIVIKKGSHPLSYENGAYFIKIEF